MSSVEATNANNAVSGSLSAAEKLRQKHEAEAGLPVTVEDIVDEEDLAHPPPSTKANVEASNEQVVPENGISAKAMGKQKAEPETDEPPLIAKPAKSPTLNTQSEEIFPALGSGPKPAFTNQSPMAWGAKKPASVRSSFNGVNGNTQISSVPSSGTATPLSGILTPVSSNAPIRPPSQGMSFPQKMQIPGKHMESIRLVPSQLRAPKELKKPLTEIVRDINRRSKAKVEMRNGGNGAVVFEGQGPVDATRQALKDLAKEVGSRQQVTVPIPLSVRPHVIGRQGATIQNIQKHTGARIQLPKNEDPMISHDEDDDGQTIDVTIEGDACAAELARLQIESIAKARSSNVNIRLRDIPAELFPFIAGPHNSRIPALEEGRQIQIQVPQYHTWSIQAPPQPSTFGVPPEFVPDPNQTIKISGDRLGVQEARAEIERQVEDLRRHITLSQIQIDQGLHQFILEHENSLHDFLEKTGCAIVMPPRTVDSETLSITGPQANIEAAKDRVIDLACTMQVSRIDIARQHANAPMGTTAHARALTRYFQYRQAIEQLERQYNARIVLPNDKKGSSDWEIYVKDGKHAMRAKQEILNLVSAFPPSRMRYIEMDPFFHQHVYEQSMDRLRNELGVHILKPKDAQSPDHLVLVYEGGEGMGDDFSRLPRRAPSPEEVMEFERILALAQQHIHGLVSGQDILRSAEILAPPQYHDKIRKFVRQEQCDLPPQRIPIQVQFQPLSMANEGAQEAQHQGLLRGPGDVDDLAARIAAFVEDEKRDEVERGLVTSFDFPQKHMSHLIGRRGENINRLREEFDIDIQTKEGRVDVIGPKAKAELARNKIISLGKQLQDESTHVLIIPSQYHRDIIGSKGGQVNHLQDRYNVRIHFPRSGGVVVDDRSTPDDASEISSLRNRRPNQGPNEVIVKGPSRGADAARDELLSLLRWTQDNSHTSTVSVAQKQLPSLIGSGGQEMEALRLLTGAQVDVPSKETGDGNERVLIQLKGTKKQVEEAKKILEQKASVFDNTVTQSVNVDSKHHKNLIGPGGSNIRNIVVAAGGSNDRRDLAKTVRFPRQGAEDNTIQVEGRPDVVEKVVAAINAFASQRDSQTTDVMHVPPEKHRLLIGHGGEARRKLESQFKIDLSIPRLNDEGPARSQVRISGQPEDVEKAKAHIMSITQDMPGVTVDIPRRHHHTIADNGQFFRRLRNNHNVTVHHEGQRPPQKPVAAATTQGNGSTPMPLITDDPDTAAPHSFVLLGSSLATHEEGTIPWILKGMPEDISKARSALEKALKAAETQPSQTTGRLVLPDPRMYKYVIGQGGSKINEIRRQTGCKINVPGKDHKKGDAIEIVGTKECVEEARDIILEVVTHGSRRD